MTSGVRGLVPPHHLPAQQTSEPGQQETQKQETGPADPRDQSPLHPPLRPQPGCPSLRDSPLPTPDPPDQSLSPLLGSHFRGEADTLSQP